MIMNPCHWLDLARLARVVFLVDWFVSALKLKEVKQREARRERLFEVAFMAVAYPLAFNDAFGRGWLGARFLPVSEALVSFYYKAKKEERFLAEEFGDSFCEHRRQTGMFLPSLGGPS